MDSNRRRPDQKAENANAAEPQPDVAPRDSQEQAEQGQAEDIPADRVGPTTSTLTLLRSSYSTLHWVGLFNHTF